MMDIRLDQRIDKATFLTWIDTVEGRYELAQGQIIAKPRPTRAHALLVTNLGLALMHRLDRHQWETLLAFGLDSGPETLRFPDVVVDHAGGSGDDYCATAPVLLGEVMSRRIKCREKDQDQSGRTILTSMVENPSLS